LASCVSRTHPYYLSRRQPTRAFARAVPRIIRYPYRFSPLISIETRDQLEMTLVVPSSKLIDFGRAKRPEGKTVARPFPVATMLRSHLTKAGIALKKK
jgi:hypothetical protein